MSEENLIMIERLCEHYEVERSLFSELRDFGILEIRSIEDAHFIHEDKISTVEKVVRMKKDLNINLEGIDTVLNLLEKISDLQEELNRVKNRLRLYEDLV